MEESRRARLRHPTDLKTDVVEPRSLPAHAEQASPVLNPEMVFLVTIRDEIDDYFIGLKRLNALPTEEVFAFLSGVSARLVEIRVQCWRSESRRLNALRTREIDPLIEEIDRQFKIHSRIQAVRTFELDMVRSAPS